MGVEYDLVSLVDGVSYELGKGPWGEIADCSTREKLRAVILDWFVRPGEDPEPEVVRMRAYATEIEEAIWTFMREHADWKLVNDSSSDYFTWENMEERRYLQEMVIQDKTSRYPYPLIFRQVGTRYRK